MSTKLSQRPTCRLVSEKHAEHVDKNHHETFFLFKTPNISRTLVGNKIVDNSDVVGASPVGAAPTTSSFST